jgi:predicted esterase
MRKYDLVFDSVSVAFGTERYAPAPKEITAFVAEPDCQDENTGLMLFTHGWDCNRFMDRDLMEYAADAWNLVCVSAEYRQSGYDFNPRTGKGYSAPYDLSFYQTFDCAGALRHVLSVKNNLNRKRIFAYGISQGGHITLLLSIFLPSTFVFINTVAALTRPLEEHQKWAGREFSADEISIRNVIEHAEMIGCPVYLEHGTADATLPHTEHAVILEKRLKELDKEFTAVYHNGGGHCLEPVITRLQALKNTVGDKIMGMTLNGDDDFQKGTVVRVPCVTKTLVIDWGKARSPHNLFHWESKA